MTFVIESMKQLTASHAQQKADMEKAQAQQKADLEATKHSILEAMAYENGIFFEMKMVRAVTSELRNEVDYFFFVCNSFFRFFVYSTQCYHIC